MNALNKYVALVIPLYIVGCGGGSSDSTDEDSFIFEQGPTVPVEPSTVVPVEEDSDPFAIRPTDVYDPSNVFDPSVCSSPYYELAGGVYSGTLALVSNNNFGLVNCTWDVELTLERSYPGSRNFCDLRMEYNVTPVVTTPVVLELGEPLDDTEEDVNIFDCFEGTVIGEGEVILGSELTDLVFPTEVNVSFRNDISGSDAFGEILFAFPDGKGVNGVTGGRIDEITFSLDSDGSLSYPDVLLPNSPWMANIQKIGSDIEE